MGHTLNWVVLNGHSRVEMSHKTGKRSRQIWPHSPYLQLMAIGLAMEQWSPVPVMDNFSPMLTFTNRVTGAMRLPYTTTTGASYKVVSPGKDLCCKLVGEQYGVCSLKTEFGNYKIYVSTVTALMPLRQIIAGLLGRGILILNDKFETDNCIMNYIALSALTVHSIYMLY